MARAIHKLQPITLSRKMAPGYHSDSGGLYLQTTKPGSKSWVFRFALGGKRREMGLGPFPTIGLATARQEAARARALVKAGKRTRDSRSRCT